MKQLDAVQQKFEQKRYVDYLQEIDDVLQQLLAQQQWSLWLTQLFNKVRAYLALNNKLAAANMLTEQQNEIATHSTVQHQMMYYHLLACASEGVESEEKVLSYLQKAQLLAQLYDEQTMLPIIYYDMSVLYERQGKTAISYTYAEKSVQLTMDEQSSEALNRKLHYSRLLAMDGRLEEATTYLEACRLVATALPYTNETIACWKVEALLLRKTVNDAAAYLFLKEKLAYVAEYSVWCDQLYEDICTYAKEGASKAIYICELEHALTMKGRVLALQNQQQLELLQAYTNDASMRRIAYTDTLTNIPNRRYLQHVYPSLTAPFTVFLFDIDFFKRVNDTSGHLIGDEVLKAIVRAVTSVMPHNGYFLRLGGDEFFGIVYEAPQQILDEILQSVRAIAILHDGRNIRPTISIGAYYVREIMTLQQLLQHADEALYEAKARGKNQYVFVNEG